MATWNYNSNEYTARNFAPIPEGDYRVTISNVTEKLFSSGNEGFEITFEVPNYNSKLWYYLVLDPRDSRKTNQRIGMFFDSFAIHDEDLSHYNDWLGKDGAVRVKHNLYNGEIKASVAFCLSRSQQKKFSDFCTTPPGNQNESTMPSASSGIQQNRFSGFSANPSREQVQFENFNF